MAAFLKEKWHENKDAAKEAAHLAKEAAVTADAETAAV
jgi:hypothetical protein